MVGAGRGTPAWPVSNSRPRPAPASLIVRVQTAPRSMATPPAGPGRRPSRQPARLHRRRGAAADIDPPALQAAIRLLIGRGHENLCSRLELADLARHIKNDGDAGRDGNLLFTVLVFQGHRLAVAGGRGCLDVAVGHGARGL